ncbi:MAG: ATP synthase subunit I [Pyrinomonadaceae bacterium]
MGEESHPSGTAQNIREISHRRILFEMAAIVSAATVLGAIFVSARFAIGVAAGGGLAFANYFWLRSSTAAIFRRAIDGSPGIAWPAAGFLLRYAALGSVLLGIYLLKALPMEAVILGLASFALAVVVDGLIGIFTSTFKKEI